MPAVPAIQTECVIIGAGPVGLFAVFELGLLGMKCEIVDSLAHPGGQCTELYPDKPIYDIPAVPVCGAQELAATGRMRYLEGTIQALAIEDGRIAGATVAARDKSTTEVRCQQLIACFGLHPKLGPVANWGLALEKKSLAVDTEKFQTSVPGIFAIGDINTYPGKKKLILSGFHEAALAAFGVQHHVYPAKRQFLQYTTTSPVMRERLGVAPPESA